ncbi:MAG TPA: DUF1667 domain-containing protein [Spirochaetia bacterium]|nr:DUF1667 domain-containing protein [Spirochaetia bacterium]
MSDKNPPLDRYSQATRSIICLRCPIGCDVQTTVDDANNVVEVKGNICKLGREYVQTEVSDPRRIFCSTVRVTGGMKPLAAVWTPKPVPKDKLLELARDTRDVEVAAPVHVGQVIIADWKGSGLDLVASDDVPKAS